MDIHHSLYSGLQCSGGKLFLGWLLPGVHLLPPCSCTPTIYRSFTLSLTHSCLKLNRKKCGSQVHWIGTGRTWMDLRDVTVAIFPSFTSLHFTLPPLVLPGGTHHPSSPSPSPCCLQLHVSQFTYEQLHYVVNQTEVAM